MFPDANTWLSWLAVLCGKLVFHSATTLLRLLPLLLPPAYQLAPSTSSPPLLLPLYRLRPCSPLLLFSFAQLFQISIHASIHASLLAAVDAAIP